MDTEQFEQLVELVRREVQPAGRANATANTLQQLLPLIPDGVDLTDLAAAWRVLSRSQQPGEAENIEGRRATCGELANLAAQIGESAALGDIAWAAKAWQAWITAFEHSDDPRQAAMAKTFAREYGELQAAI